MPSVRLLVLPLVVGVALASSVEARGVSPRNPYRSFNLSGLNYGSMQWEKAQRQGRQAWPDGGASSRGGSITAGVGAGGGGVVQQQGAPRPRRGLFRRR